MYPYTRRMAVRLHRCSLLWFKLDGHPCWRVQKALDEADVPYELVEGRSVAGGATGSSA